MDGDLHDIHPASLKMFQLLSLGRVLRTGFVSTANGTCCGILYKLAVMAPRPVHFGYIEQGPLTSFRRCPVSEGAINDYMASSRPNGIITNYSISTSTKLEKSRTFTLSFRLVL